MTKVRNVAIAGAAGALALGALALQGDAAPVRCALVIDGALERFQTFDGSCPPDPKGKPTFKWLSAPEVAPPTFNSETQIRTRNDPAIGATQVRDGWTVRSKTTQELDDEKTDTVNRINRAVIKVLCRLENHDRVSDGKTALTQGQCITAFKGLL